MSKIKLTGDSSGYVEISAPSAAGNNTLELPANGSKIVVSDGSDNINVAGIATIANGLNVTGGFVGINSISPERRLDVVDSGASGSVIRSRVTTNNGGYLAYEALNSSGNQVFYVSHNGRIGVDEGIIFGSDTAAENVLDDYEEGSWTPTLTNFSGGSPSYQYQEGYYTKIGRYVIAQGIMGITNSNTLGSGTIQINLPFTAGSTVFGQCGPVADGSGFTSFSQFGTMVGDSASVGRFITIATLAQEISYNQPSSNWYVRFCFMYHTV